MDAARIAELLGPFLGDSPLNSSQLTAVSTYLDLLLRWNAKMNLTSLRDPAEIITRHFGESFFLARQAVAAGREVTCVDVGSGAGFPGLPLKLYRPRVRLTLVEAQYRKAIFLREVIRALDLAGAEVFAGRAEEMAANPTPAADLVTMRAVERFEEVLPVAARLVRQDQNEVGRAGALALLIGAAGADRIAQLLPGFRWGEPMLVPQSSGRLLLLGWLETGKV